MTCKVKRVFTTSQHQEHVYAPHPSRTREATHLKVNGPIPQKRNEAIPAVCPPGMGLPQGSHDHRVVVPCRNGKGAWPATMGPVAGGGGPTMGPTWGGGNNHGTLGFGMVWSYFPRHIDELAKRKRRKSDMDQTPIPVAEINTATPS